MAKVVDGSVSCGQLLVGDRVCAVNGTAVKSHSHALVLLRECGPQVTIDVQRGCTVSDELPTGQFQLILLWCAWGEE